MQTKRYYGIGVMSGSSLDGTDLALVSLNLKRDPEPMIESWSIISSTHVPFPPDLKVIMQGLNALNPYQLLEVDVELGKYWGDLISEFVDQNAADKEVFIALHGHTVTHHPESGYSLQIGHPAQVAAITGKQVIADFRNTDIAHLGQGAPLAPLADHYLFPGHNYYLNLGGIANLTVNSHPYRAFDVAPCNQILNHFAGLEDKAFDNEGQMAREGKIHDDLLKQWRAMPYFSYDPPKSMDNEWVIKEFLPIAHDFNLNSSDLLRTSTELITSEIVRSIEWAEIDDVKSTLMVTGGGAFNSFLVEQIQEKVHRANIDVRVPDKDIVDFKEAILMALAGLFRLERIPNTFSSVTGALHDTVGGAVYHGSQ